jgi:hypothetical protein
VPPGEYTFYLWGFDNKSAKVKMTQQLTLNPWVHRTILEKDDKGIALARPILYLSDLSRGTSTTAFAHTLKKWIVGNDPDDSTLLETCKDMGWTDVGGLAFLPTDQTRFFHCWLKGSTRTNVVRAWTWVPKGDAVLRTDWGINGEYTYSVASPQGWDYGPGVVSDGIDCLFCVNSDMSNNGKESQLIYVNINSGIEIKRLDLSPWWVSLTEGDAAVGAQYNGGPFILSLRKNVLFAGSHQSCVNQLIDPYYQSTDGAILWVNRNGDYVGDKNFETTSKKPWVCNDYNVGPYKYSFSPDNNLFSIFPCFDMGALSFGLYAPDGTGIGYKAYAGETAGQKYGTDIIDYGSSYDGIYTTQNGVLGADGRTYTIPNGFWFVAQDSFKGIIGTSGSYIYLSSPSGGEIWGTGSAKQITWTAIDILTVKIEYSTDNGVTWKTITEAVDAARGAYVWMTAGIQSSTCLVRITSTADNKIQSTSSGLFTITPPTIKVTSPNGGEKWASGTMHPITWNAIGTERVNLEYSLDNGGKWEPIGTVNTSSGSFNWTVPTVESELCLVKITDPSTPSLTDTGDGVFTIIRPYINLISPNGGEVWGVGKNNTVTWVAEGVDKVNVEYSVDGGITWNSIASGVAASSGSYAFTLDFQSALCLVRVSDQSGTVSDKSDAVFTIASLISVEDYTPKEFAVFQNTPNPFNPRTTISFTLPQADHVTVDVYNLAGQRVDSILDGKLSAGRHILGWNAARFSAGIYFCLVRTEKESKTIKMLLLK